MKRIILICLLSFTPIINFSCTKSDESNSVKSDPAGCVECGKKKLQVQLSEPLIIANQQDSLVLALYNCKGFTQYNGRKFGEDSIGFLSIYITILLPFVYIIFLKFSNNPNIIVED
ncbi:MAG: hypothetical protein Q7U54_00720 [Bacteroidales bacterium]|nr:hypothetical protein [Bacteroidales bacterium]